MIANDGDTSDVPHARPGGMLTTLLGRWSPYWEVGRAFWRRWRFPLLVSMIAVTVQFGGWAGPLRYDAAAVARGQWWRLVTGNLVHLGWVHLWRDLAALFIIWFGFSRCLSERGWTVLFLWNALAVTVGLYVFTPSVHWYVGLSGILYGFVVCAGLLLLPSRPLLGAVMVVGTTALVLYGVLIGPLPGQALGLGGKVIPQAHLFGMVGAAAFAAARYAIARPPDTRRIGRGSAR